MSEQILANLLLGNVVMIISLLNNKSVMVTFLSV